jgi:hypothetical protein
LLSIENYKLLNEKHNQDDKQKELTKYLLSFCCSNAKLWKKKEYIAPYAAVIQGSGVGKSFSIHKISQKKFAFEVCLRDAGSTGFPMTSDIKSLLSDHDGKFILDAHLIEIKKFLQINCTVFVNDPSARLFLFYVSFLHGCLKYLADSLNRMIYNDFHDS